MQSMRTIMAVVGGLILAVVHLSIPSASALERNGEIVRIGYTEFEPFSWTDVNGVPRGYSIDLIRILLEKRGHLIDFVPFENPANLLDAFERKEIDATSLLGVKPERAALGIFSDAIRDAKPAFFVLQDRPPPKTFADLEGLRIGVSAGSLPARLLADVPGIGLVNMESGDALLLPLLRGDVDVVAMPADAFLRLAAHAGVSDRIAMSVMPNSATPLAILVQSDLSELARAINDGISDSKLSGALMQLEQSWFPPLIAQPIIIERIAIGGLLIASILGVLAAALLFRNQSRKSRSVRDKAEMVEEALNVFGASVIVFDEALRPVWWNERHVQNYPQQAAAFRSGATLEELIERSLQNGVAAEQMPSREAAAEAKRRIAKLKTGGELRTILNGQGGSRLKRITLEMPSGRYAAFTTDVTLLIEAQEREAEIREELTAANKRLKDFNRVAAHDIRSPLRAIHGLQVLSMQQLARQSIELPDHILENFNLIVITLEQQLDMTEDLIEYFSQSEASKAKEFDPADRIPRICLQAAIPSCFLVTHPEEFPLVNADPVAFDIVLRNLLSNAVKHHDRESGVIQISCVIAGDKCLFDVYDDGPGIPEGYREKIFEPFTTVKSKADGGGTGLGLSMVKNTVESWGGTISVYSPPKGRGTYFRFSVPASSSIKETNNVVPLGTRTLAS